MHVRDLKQSAEEQAVFDAFLTAHPAFAATVARMGQPEAEFPDRIVTLQDGSQIDFELVEWLHQDQMAHAKRRAHLAESIERAIGQQGENRSQHFRFVVLFPRPELPRFERTDAGHFHAEIWTLIDDTQGRWPTERGWRSPQGRQVYRFDAYPALGKYLTKVIFDPLVIAGRRRERFPAGVPWIAVAASASSYSPDKALSALHGILQAKIRAYGGLCRPTYLLVYYGAAVAYNTPWYGLDFREFRDVAAAAARIVAGQSSFERIYLLKALEPGLEAYEIFPGFTKCA